MDDRPLPSLNCNQFTALLASKAPTPGGGGASALAGALAAALGRMVGALTVGKPKYAAVESELVAHMERAETLRIALLQGIERDAAAFEPLSRAYAIPKDDPARQETLETCLVTAAQAPLQIAALCAEVIELLRAFADKGSPLAVSDAATGAALARGALLGAAVNVKVNTALMQNATQRDALDREIDALTERYVPLADAIFQEIYGRYCK